MWWILIVIVVVVFLFFIYALNPDKVKALFKRKRKEPKAKVEKPKEKDKTPTDPNFSYNEYKPEEEKKSEIKVDNLNEKKDKGDIKSSQVAYTTLKEEIAKEKAEINSKETGEGQDKSREGRLVKGGRKSGAVKGADIKKVEVEDLGEYNEDAGFDDDEDTSNLNQSVDDFEIGDDDYDMFNMGENKSIGQEIKNLSPELKALLIDNVLDKKIDDDKK